MVEMRFSVAPSPLLASTILSPILIASRRDGPGIAAEIARSAQHELHRHAERRVVLHDFRIDRLQMLEQSRPGIPGHPRGAFDHVVAGQRRHRNDGDLREFEAPGHGAEVPLDLAVARLRPSRRHPSC